jgi:hypothetical protein
VGDSTPQKADRELSGRKKWFWGMQKNRVEFLHKYAKERAILSPAQWREVTLREIAEAGGRGLIDYHASSMWRILGDLYDEGTVRKVLQGRRMAKGHWEDVSNVRTFLEDVASRLEIETPEDWRAVRLEEVVELGGAGMLKQYKDSLFSALEHAYGDEVQAFLCRPSIPQRFWQSSDNVRAFLLHAREELEISSKEEWDRVSRAQLLSVKGGYGLLSVMTLPEAVRFAFPEEDWPAPGLPHTKKAAQRHLLLSVRKLLPSVDFIEDYHHSLLAGSERGGGTKRSLELDIFSSALRLAFGTRFHSSPMRRHNSHSAEYNGKQHYEELAFFGPLEAIQSRDEEKARLCEQQGIRLITVPHWWDGSVESLACTIHRRHPEILG